ITEIDISIWDQLISGNNKPGVTIAQALRLSLYESLAVSYSKMSYSANSNQTITNANRTALGLEITLDGFKKMYLDKKMPFFKPISFRYTYSSFSSYSTEFGDESSLNGFELIYSF